jgi:hypothetical protein
MALEDTQPQLDISQVYQIRMGGSGYVPTSDPKKNISLILKFGNSKLSHFIIRHSAIRELEHTRRKSKENNT